MATTRLCLASINPVVGDLAGNARQVVEATGHAAAEGCRMVAFPEMALTGYPCEDLALRASFREASIAATHELAADLARSGLQDVQVVVGYLGARDGKPTNSAAVITRGEVRATYDKNQLPNYGVFDEERWFAAGDRPCVLNSDGVQFCIAICEDIWQEGSPALKAAESADALLVINASPFEMDKQRRREDLCRRRAMELGCTVAYVNAVGGQDELVFDGGALVVSPSGQVVLRSARFDTRIVTVDISTRPGSDGSARRLVEPDLEPLDAIYAALVLGLRDYVVKNGLDSVAVGLSGGIDSALVATIACDAVGPDNVLGVSMPSKYSSSHSRDDAAELARRTGLHLRTVPIEPMLATFHHQLRLVGTAEENLQARIRGNVLMAISNAEGQLVLATGNKSEIAVGYSTIYGDAVGGFAPIKDVPKTMVWGLAKHRNGVASRRGETEPIPERSITKAPSAELRPGQLDTDSLPDYEVLDAIVHGYVEKRASSADLVSAGFDPATVRKVLSLTDAAEYKRRQYPPGPKITSLAFGRDRRLPITNRWRDPVPDTSATVGGIRPPWQ